MARDTDLHEIKRKEVVEFFKKLDEVRECGVKKYTIAYCTAKTAEKFFLRPKTIENYLYR